ncbi:ABC transporter permease [Chryseolinea lacunae]|uniref:ABC transporter permease n=1 Tax=Chryseolinea lacunae TaxID=2801331 RepID=A0ABS1KL33_9BACT|nr:ABC transporter permease [Chryseolinea lacunae]MBL0740044.1 ABC transporter permease [Chryseolinea lacunae]
MLINHLKIAFRNITRNPSYAFINIGGLALGMSCVIILFALVKHHLNFENFHSDGDRVYRVVTEQHRDEVTYTAHVPNPFGKVFRDDYTFGEKVARQVIFDHTLVAVDEQGEAKKFKDDLAFAEEEFFDIFNFPVLHGATRLHEPNTAFITERLARKYFGDDNPLSKTLRLNNLIDVKIVGILKDIPENTDLQVELFVAYGSLKRYDEWMASDDSWGGISSSMSCFVRLRPGVAPAQVEAALPALVKKYRPTHKNVHVYRLQPLHDMHYNARFGGPMEKRDLWVLSFVGFFLLVTACVNFVNLATAQALNRAHEVGVRKVLGSMRAQLFWQFMTETSCVVVLAMVIAISLAAAMLPTINLSFGSRMALDFGTDGGLQLFVPVLAVLVTFIAGAYPGLLLSGYRPAMALKGKLSSLHAGGFNLRRSLIVMQFTISQVLVIGLIVVVYQMRYATKGDIGFAKDAIVMVPIGSQDTRNTLRNELARVPGVEQISQCYDAPASDMSWRTTMVYEGRTEPEDFAITFRGADDQYVNLFNLTLVAGRNLEPSDTVREFLVNETLVQKLNLSSPEAILGTVISADGGDYKARVVGVVKDFHDRTFHEDVSPMFFSTAGDMFNFYALKVKIADLGRTIAAIDKVWSAQYPNQIFEYQFLDEKIAGFYQTEETLLKLIQVFAGIAIAIGCMGLYGLVSFMANQKTKEIGIRKVLGGTVTHILWIFGREFSALVVFSFVIAGPIAWWLMHAWLQDFKYAVALEPWIFMLAFAVTVVIALLTVGYQSMKAAAMNPATSLKTE